MAEEAGFPTDPVLCYPCFIIRSENGRGFICHDMAEGGVVMPIMTDEDAMDRYRRAKGLPDRGALRFDSAAELFQNLCQTPAALTHVTLDPCPDRAPNLCKPVKDFLNDLEREILRS